MATTREVLKIGKVWTVVSSAENEASYRLPSRKAAEAHKAMLERNEAEAIAHRAEYRAARIEAARAYLAARAARAAADTQLSLF